MSSDSGRTTPNPHEMCFVMLEEKVSRQFVLDYAMNTSGQMYTLPGHYLRVRSLFWDGLLRKNLSIAKEA